MQLQQPCLQSMIAFLCVFGWRVAINRIKIHFLFGAFVADSRGYVICTFLRPAERA